MSVEKFTATNVSDAISLAEQFKKEGKYDWFRGQSNSEWKVRSTRLRKELEGDWDKVKYRTRIKNIFEWFAKSELTNHYLQSDAAGAIIQHYRVPTDFIDFTTEPLIAGFFANDIEHINQKEKAAIICLDSKDLERHYKDLESIFKEHKFPLPEKIVIDVANLWRLQAQYGVFLFCRFDIENFGDLDYRFDRIEFPISPQPDELKSIIVYPERKSQLEEKLDKFFAQEKWEENITIAMPLIMSGKLDVLNYDDTYEKSPYKLDENRHESWLNNNLKGWLSSTSEVWQEVTNGSEIHLRIEKNQNPEELLKSLIAQLEGVLVNNPEIRGKLSNFICDIEGETKENIVIIEHQIQRLWDGIRVLPYSDSQIIQSIASLVVMIFSSKYQFKNEASILNNCPMIEEPLLCAFSDKRRYDSRGVASKRKLLQAIRPDIDKFGGIVEFYYSKDIENLFIRCPFPSTLFDFNLFTDIFIKEVVPSQCVLRGADYSVVFSPAELVRFGIP